MERTDNGLFFRSDVPPNEHQFRTIELEWLQFQACDFSLASNSKQQLRIDPATLGANNCRGRIDFPQFRFKRLDLPRLDEIDLVQQQDVCAFDLQTGRVAEFRKTNYHVSVDH